MNIPETYDYLVRIRRDLWSAFDAADAHLTFDFRLEQLHIER
jgi:hypothetical protein